MAEIQTLVGQVRIQSFASDSGNYFASDATNTKTAPLPSLDDWSQFGGGIKANTSLGDATAIALNQATYWKTTNSTNGLMALNSALDAQTATVNQTLLQTIVDSYGRILQEADGSRSTNTDVSKVAVSSGTSLTSADVVQADLENLGVSYAGTDDNASGTGLHYLRTGDLLASSIGSLASTAVDTVVELNTLSGYAQNVMKLAAGTNTYTDAEWITAFAGLGVSGVTTSNVTA